VAPQEEGNQPSEIQMVGFLFGSNTVAGNPYGITPW
jgi:hypothetical protein